jgi:hypothetical protein
MHGIGIIPALSETSVISVVKISADTIRYQISHNAFRPACLYSLVRGRL